MNQVIFIRVAPDMRPTGYPAFLISGSSIDEIVDIVRNGNYIVLIWKIEKI